MPDFADCFRTGRLKHGYGVGNILKMLGRDKGYSETHNAEDELQIMRLLGRGLSQYDIAHI